MSPFLIARVHPNYRDFSVALLSIGLVAWIVNIFNYGLNNYSIGSHLFVAIFGLMTSLASKKSERLDYALACAFACDVYICCIGLWWHHVFPIYWVIRNMMLSYALFVLFRFYMYI
jgi:hypothetical protein